MSCTSVRENGENHSDALKPVPFRSPRDVDTETLAVFLLALKHRSVTPEPTMNDSGTSTPSCGHARLETSPSRNNSPVNYDSSSDDACSPPQSPPHISSHLMDSDPQSGDPHRQQLIDFESLIADSKLVCMDDQDLVPDPLFAAMAQMKPCRLQYADRVGCYKNRELGFIGMCCKWCGGQPGFGRYYPNSVRSLAQTTTSQTILKHIGSKCRFCPPDVRNAILELQEVQAAREGLPTGRPRYGSRKIFFQRVWQRLHNGKVTKDLDEGDEKTSVTIESSEDGSFVTNSEDESSGSGSGAKRALPEPRSYLCDQRSRKRSKMDDPSDSSVPLTVV
ncbi:hypothetical protein ACA910_019950 [Epithemia clementina (nom. ined.)]